MDNTVTTPPHVWLHVGTPKTGTTSIQAFLKSHTELLAASGYSLITCPRGKPNYKLLTLSSLLPSRRPLIKMRGMPSALGLPFMRWRVRRNIAKQIANSGSSQFIVSNESLSYLRHVEEVQALRALFPADCRLTVILVLRDKQDFLASRRKQILKQKLPISNVNGSSTYVEGDSWLIDYGSIASVFKTIAEDVKVIDYDLALRADNNIIPAFLDTLGMRTIPEAVDLYFLNRKS